MKKVFLALIIALMLSVSVSGMALANEPLAPAYGQNVNLTGVEYVKITQADVFLEKNNPGVPAYVKNVISPAGYQVNGYLWDLNRKPVLGMPPVFAYVYIGNGMTLEIAKVMPIYNYGAGLSIDCALISRADIFMDPSPSNVGVPAFAKDVGYLWDISRQPVLELPPVGAYVLTQGGIAKIIK